MRLGCKKVSANVAFLILVTLTGLNEGGTTIYMLPLMRAHSSASAAATAAARPDGVAGGSCYQAFGLEEAFKFELTQITLIPIIYCVCNPSCKNQKQMGRGWVE